MKFDRIKQLRMESGITRDELADQIGISSSALGNYERGEREPNAVLVVKLAEHFRVTSDYILGLSDNLTAAVEWPSDVTDEEAMGNVHAIKEAIEDMLISVKNNPYGLQTFDSYATIINLLPDIDKFVAAQLAELQIDYPAYRMFGTESEMEFDGKKFLQAMIDRSEDATKFAEQLIAAKTRIHDKILEIHGVIGDVLGIWVFDAIKGLPLEKQPLYVDRLKTIKQSLGTQYQATETKDADGGEDGGNSQETRE